MIYIYIHTHTHTHTKQRKGIYIKQRKRLLLHSHFCNISRFCLQHSSIIIYSILILPASIAGWPSGASGKESAHQCRWCKRQGFNPLVGKIPWRRKWQPTPVFLPGKSHGLRSLAGYSPWGHKELDVTDWLGTHTHSWLNFSYDMVIFIPEEWVLGGSINVRVGLL